MAEFPGRHLMGATSTPSLVSISAHALLLARVFEGLAQKAYGSGSSASGENVDWISSYDWTYTACRVTNIEMEPDPAGATMMCRPAWEYEEARAAVLTKFTTELVKFNFIWGAFESTMKVISPDGYSDSGGGRYGLVRATYKYVGMEGEYFPLPVGYRRQLECIRSQLYREPSIDRADKYFTMKDGMGLAGIGIYVVSKLRNKFAHGAATLPTPDEYDFGSIDNTPYAHIVTISSRITMLTMQMALMRYYRGQDIEIEWARGIWDYEQVRLSELLRTLHVEVDNAAIGQMPIFDYIAGDNG